VKTTQLTPQDVQKQWVLIDAEGLVLGRLATKVATILRGKHKPTFTPHVDCGDFVVVINADKIVLTGKKLDQKIYRKHSGYVGGLKETPYKVMMQKKPDFVVWEAVRGMMPKGPLGRLMMRKLKVYRGEAHPHAAQQPQTIQL